MLCHCPGVALHAGCEAAGSTERVGRLGGRVVPLPKSATLDSGGTPQHATADSLPAPRCALTPQTAPFPSQPPGPTQLPAKASQPRPPRGSTSRAAADRAHTDSPRQRAGHARERCRPVPVRPYIRTRYMYYMYIELCLRVASGRARDYRYPDRSMNSLRLLARSTIHRLPGSSRGRG